MAGLFEKRLSFYLKHRQDYSKAFKLMLLLDDLALIQNPTRSDVLKFNDTFAKFNNYINDLTFRNEYVE